MRIEKFQLLGDTSKLTGLRDLGGDSKRNKDDGKIRWIFPNSAREKVALLLGAGEGGTLPGGGRGAGDGGVIKSPAPFWPYWQLPTGNDSEPEPQLSFEDHDFDAKSSMWEGRFESVDWALSAECPTEHKFFNICKVIGFLTGALFSAASSGQWEDLEKKSAALHGALTRVTAAFAQGTLPPAICAALHEEATHAVFWSHVECAGRSLGIVAAKLTSVLKLGQGRAEQLAALDHTAIRSLDALQDAIKTAQLWIDSSSPK